MLNMKEFMMLSEAERKKLTGGTWKRMGRGGSIYVDHDGNILAGGNPALHKKIEQVKKGIYQESPEKIEIDKIIFDKMQDIINLVQDEDKTELRQKYPTIWENAVKVQDERVEMLRRLNSGSVPQWSINTETAKIERDFSKRMSWLSRADSYNDISNAIYHGMTKLEDIIINELGQEANKKIQKLMDENIDSSINLTNNPWLKSHLDVKILDMVKDMLKENPLSSIDVNPFYNK